MGTNWGRRTAGWIDTGANVVMLLVAIAVIGFLIVGGFYTLAYALDGGSVSP